MDVGMTKEQYEKKYAEIKEICVPDPWRLKYHLMPEQGWLNDPNGLCHFQGVYHVYYQYSPFDVDGKTKLWGHMTSKDFTTWKQEEPVLFPDSKWDDRGVYSGSAFIEDGQIQFFYTGNVKLFDQDYDYINAGREQNTIRVTSQDGFQMSEKELLLTNCDYPSDMSCHVRDPKIYKKDDRYYMVLGARDLSSKGCVLVYESDDLTNWKYRNRIQSEEAFGYMWECPDLFDLDGQTVLITCPQGVKAEGYNYANVHQCGSFFVDGNICEDYHLSSFHQMDRGFDFYAPQSFEDAQGRRILIGWMGLPDIDYTNPTVAHGWQHALTMPRELHVKNGILCQQPIQEMEKLRGIAQETSVEDLAQLHFQDRVYECCITIEKEDDFQLQLRETTTLRYDYASRVLTLVMGENGYGRGMRSVQLPSLRNLRIYSDTSSLEIFVNDGEEVFTTRVYEEENNKELAFVHCKMQGNVVLYKLDGYQYL